MKTNISVESASHFDVSRLADIALKNRLYVSGWQLSGMLRRMRKTPKEGDFISIVSLDGQPISVAIKIAESITSIAAFTRKKYRKSGYGKKAVNALVFSAKNQSLTGNFEGGKGCDDFFKKCGLIVHYWNGPEF